MSMKLNVGLTRKIGLPNYGSLGAACYVEVELEQSLLFHSRESLQDRIEQAYLACRQAIDEELARSGQGARPQGANPGSIGNGQTHTQSTNGTPQSSMRPATPRQIRAIEIMALRQRLDILALLERRFDKALLADLSRSEASHLIDELATTAEGRETAKERSLAEA